MREQKEQTEQADGAQGEQEEFATWWNHAAQWELRKSCAMGWGEKVWRAARAALAQPSPERGQVVVTKKDGIIVAVTRQDAEGRVLSVIAESQPSPELEQYKAILRTLVEEATCADWSGENDESVFHAAQQWCGKYHEAKRQLEAAQARVAELEAEKNTVECRFEVSEDTLKVIRGCLREAEADIESLQEQVAQAGQLHELDKQCRDDVARALGLTPQGDGYAWSALLADIKTAAKVAQAGQVPEVSGIARAYDHPRAVILYLRKEPTDDDLRAIQEGLRVLAAAPPKEGE